MQSSQARARFSATSDKDVAHVSTLVTTTAAEDGDEVEDEDETDASGLRLRCMG